MKRDENISSLDLVDGLLFSGSKYFRNILIRSKSFISIYEMYVQSVKRVSESLHS